MSTKEIKILDFELGKLVIKPKTDMSRVNKVIKKRVQKIKRAKEPVKVPV